MDTNGEAISTKLIPQVRGFAGRTRLIDLPTIGGPTARENASRQTGGVTQALVEGMDDPGVKAKSVGTLMRRCISEVQQVNLPGTLQHAVAWKVREAGIHSRSGSIPLPNHVSGARRDLLISTVVTAKGDRLLLKMKNESRKTECVGLLRVPGVGP